MYQQIESDNSSTIIVKRSKFIANIMPIDSQQDAEDKLSKLRKRYSDATHNCYAYVADDKGNLVRFSDDKEPQGTAGQPILERLRNANLSKTLAVVTRYFGGIKLGAAGLVCAYSDAVSEAIKNASIKQFYLSQIITVTIDYTQIKYVTDTIARFTAKIMEMIYNKDITVKIAVDIEQYDELKSKLIDVTRGQIQLQQQNSEYISY